jgi:hypothetical protein
MRLLNHLSTNGYQPGKNKTKTKTSSGLERLSKVPSRKACVRYSHSARRWEGKMKLIFSISPSRVVLWFPSRWSLHRVGFRLSPDA